MKLRPFLYRITGSYLVLIFLLCIEGAVSSGWAQAAGTGPIYVPIVLKTDSNSSGPRVNIPYFAGDIALYETSIFWMGRVNYFDNYADVRLGYNATYLYVRVSVFDRRVWFTDSPSPPDLTNWDAIGLLLDLDGNTGNGLDNRSYRFVGQSRWAGSNVDYQAAYIGGPSWNLASIPFTTQAYYVSINNPADDTDDRGWEIIYHIPFSSLGLSGPPTTGTRWGLGIELYDRDSAAGPPLAVKVWPPSMDEQRSSTWGQLSFGLPTYTPPPSAPGGTITVRQGVNGAVVKDAHVGGHTTCGQPFNPDFFNGWGDANYAGYTQVNIQNQANLGDWPCFSKFYITFPLNNLPAGKTIISASLRLYQFGNSDPQQAYDSLIQVFSVNEDWNESTITWNNAPYAWENISRTWVPVLATFPGLPGVPSDWDVSAAVAEAYRRGTPLRLVLYSADTPMHSGKYFYSSDMDIYAQTSRPMLTVQWGTP